MSGTEFLRRVRALYPETVRIVLSGYADIESVTSAINDGAIYKFLTKPWEEDALRSDLRHAFRLFDALKAGDAYPRADA
jgi:response regulator RpfG family c-di-GMP phosphodiesterase